MKMNIQQVAELARLTLNAEEAVRLEKNLEAILAYVETLNGLPTDKVEPTSHVLSSKNVFREDKVEPSDVRSNVLEHAPSREGKFFKVPKVIERD